MREMTMHYQQLQQQIDAVMMQKETVKMQILEIENALSELKGYTGDVYKSSGVLMLKTTPDGATKALVEKKDVLDLRIKTLQKRESSVREELSVIQIQLNTHMKENGLI